jgi:hypothetical protein
MVPFYLLQEEASRFPTYVDKSEFNNDQYDYPISIKISSTIQDAYVREQQRKMESHRYKLTKPDSETLALPEYIEIPHFSILSPARSLIEAVWKRILHQTNISLVLQERVLVLKFVDVDAYVYGDTQLIYFVEVREHIRNKT